MMIRECRREEQYIFCQTDGTMVCAVMIAGFRGSQAQNTRVKMGFSCLDSLEIRTKEQYIENFGITRYRAEIVRIGAVEPQSPHEPVPTVAKQPPVRRVDGNRRIDGNGDGKVSRLQPLVIDDPKGKERRISGH